MFELINLKGNTYCYTMPTNVGIYVNDDNSVYLIDTGVNQRSAQRVLAVLEERGWSLRAVLLTHAHTDHAGGCKYIVETTGCKVYATQAERIFVEYPDLEPAMVYGSFPCKDFRGKVMNTPACPVCDINDLKLPRGFEIFHLPGHFADMIGFKTPDDVYFVADSVIAAETLEKSPMSYILDVESHYATLEKIKVFQGELCVPSHAQPTRDIVSLAAINADAMNEIEETLLYMLESPKTAEELTELAMEKWNMPQSFQGHVMALSCVRAHLTYLRHKAKVEYFFEGPRMLWEKA